MRDRVVFRKPNYRHEAEIVRELLAANGIEAFVPPIVPSPSPHPCGTPPRCLGEHESRLPYCHPRGFEVYPRR